MSAMYSSNRQFNDVPRKRIKESIGKFADLQALLIVNAD